jgi:hypothetical protein
VPKTRNFGRSFASGTSIFFRFKRKDNPIPSMVWPFSSSKPQASAESSQDSSNEPVLILQEPQTVESSEARERRRYMLVDAVRENCAFDAAAFMDCQKSWSLWNRGTLCQAAQFKFTDCMNVQRVCDRFEAKY